MLNTPYFEMSEVPASFSRDQIAFFRAQFATHVPPEGRGLDEAGFLDAARASIEHASLYNPGDDALRRDFQRLKRNDCLPWTNFFQVSNVCLIMGNMSTVHYHNRKIQSYGHSAQWNVCGQVYSIVLLLCNTVEL